MQLRAHCPLGQVCPDGQAIPHAPQFPISTERSRQNPLQSVKPDRQFTLPLFGDEGAAVVPCGCVAGAGVSYTIFPDVPVFWGRIHPALNTTPSTRMQITNWHVNGRWVLIISSM
ncbi:MAG: hypothetical protein NTW33_12420 [Methanoregula sp.]|nr:hypothetical protein [Methanoregula sp.]